MSSWQKLIGTNLRELRFVFCQNSQRSLGLRNYIAKNYWNLKNENPNFPLIVRECEEADPYIIARYQYGVEKKAFAANNNEADIENIIKTLVEQANKVNSQMQK